MARKSFMCSFVYNRVLDKNHATFYKYLIHKRCDFQKSRFINFQNCIAMYQFVHFLLLEPPPTSFTPSWTSQELLDLLVQKFQPPHSSQHVQAKRVMAKRPLELSSLCVLDWFFVTWCSILDFFSGPSSSPSLSLSLTFSFQMFSLDDEHQVNKH